MKYAGIWNYSQPDFYHFSDDATFLASEVSSYIYENKLEVKNGLDLCAGCGVIGLELLSRGHQFRSFTFCEKQGDFFKHIEENIKHFNKKNEDIVMSIKSSLEELENNQGFDIIVCNPPYFLMNEGRLPLNENKKICRFINEDELAGLFIGMKATLSKRGKAFFLWRTDLERKDFFADEDIQLLKEKNSVGLFLMSSLHKD